MKPWSSWSCKVESLNSDKTSDTSRRRRGESMKVLHGDLISLALAGHFEAIVHGCNCFCTMGAGIAKAIRDH